MNLFARLGHIAFCCLCVLSLGREVQGQPVPHILALNTKPTASELVSPSLCELNCFAATYSFGTVPYFSLDEARNVQLVYNGDQAVPRPFIHVNVTGSDDGQGLAYTLQATLNGAAVTFLNGETVLRFAGSGGVPVRLGGQFDARSYATNVYPLTITVKATWSDGVTVTKSANTQLIIVNEANSQVARGWTIAGLQRLVTTTSPGYMITNGDGSATRFSGLGVVAADFTTLTYDSPSATYTRTYPDGARALFNAAGLQISFIETNGRTRSFGYDGSGRIQTIGDPFRKQPNQSPTFIGLSYDANGLRFIQEPSADGTAWAGRTTYFVVDGNRCLLNAQDPDGVFTRFTCDSNGRLSTITDRLGSVTTLGYDAMSWKLAQVILPVVPVDAGGGATTLTNPVVNLTTWQIQGVPQSPTSGASWDAPDLANVTGSVTDPKGRTTSFAPNDFGQAIAITDPAGLITTIGRSGLLPTRITYPTGGTDTLMYDALGRVTRSHPSGGSATDYHYGANGLVDVISGAGNRLDSLTYVAGNLSKIVFAGTPRQTISYSYNPATLRVSVMSDNSGHTTSYTYDGRFGNLDGTTLPGNRITTTLFDKYGRDSATTPPGVATQVSLYDIMNRVTSSSAGGTTMTLGYNSMFQTDVTDANSNHYHTDYNALGWPTNQCDALSHCSTARYDASALLMSATNRRGQIVSVTRDGMGRITSKTGTNLVPSYFSYSPNGRDMVAWNAVARDSIFVNPGSWTVAATDSIVTWIDGKRYRIYHRYPKAVADFDTTTITSNTGTTFNPRVATYAATGFLSSFKVGPNTVSFSPDADGTGGILGYPFFNRTSAALALHTTGSAQFSNGLAGTFQRQYHYDPTGRIDQSNVGTVPSSQTKYSYDALGRLSNTQVRSGCSLLANDSLSGKSYNCPTLNSSVSFSYDAMGNRTDVGGVPTTGNRYVVLNGASYYYDLDGNLIQKYKAQVYNRQYYWNATNQLDSALKDGWYRTAFDYNAFGKPVRIWDGDPNGRHVARYLLWDGEALAAELTPSGQREVDYAYLPGTIDLPFAMTLGATSPTTTRFHEVDELGNVLGTSQSGALSQNNSYDSWGSVGIGGNSDSHLFWKGLFWNGDNTGLYYMRNRWYDPEGGRFVSEDPAGFGGGINLYAFGGNNPVNSSDPSGLDIECVRGPGRAYMVEQYVLQIDGGALACHSVPSSGGGTGDSGGSNADGGTSSPGESGAGPGKSKAAGQRAPDGTLPSCNSVQYRGNTGTIHVQYNPRSNSLQWGVVMNSPLLMGGLWTFSEFVGDKRINTRTKTRDMLHNSVNSVDIVHGAVFRLGVSYIDPFGFSHTNVPNACIIP